MTTAPASEQQVDVVGWSTAAADYDQWFDESWGRYAFAVEASAMIRAAGHLAGTRVLDAGCGTGRFSAAISGRGALVVGVDPDADMLTLAAPRLASRCGRGVVEHLPFPDAAFDLTLAVTVLEFVPEPAVAVAELSRVTRRGGRIVIGALNPHSPWGLANRRKLRSGVWCDALFLSRAALRSLGESHGRTAVHGALYAPGAFPGLALVGRGLEAIGKLAPSWGAFQLLVIDTRHPDG